MPRGDLQGLHSLLLAAHYVLKGEGKKKKNQEFQHLFHWLYLTCFAFYQTKIDFYLSCQVNAWLHLWMCLICVLNQTSEATFPSTWQKHLPSRSQTRLSPRCALVLESPLGPHAAEMRLAFLPVQQREGGYISSDGQDPSRPSLVQKLNVWMISCLPEFVGA